MDYWELSQEFSETIFLEVGFNLYDIFIDNVPVDSIKANKWLEGYMQAEDAIVEGEYLLDGIKYIISEEETMYDESYMNIAVSIYETCIEDKPISSLDDFFDDVKVVSNTIKVDIEKTNDNNDEIENWLNGN